MTALGEVESDGYRTRIRSAGQGRPLVLLHGAGGDGSLFDGSLELLAGSRRVIAPDMLGHGSTTGPLGGFTPGAYCRWLRSFLDEIAPGPVDLAGHSLGGALAVRFAARYPERVRRLVLIDSIALGAPDLRSTLLLLVATFSRDRDRKNELVAQVMLYRPTARSQPAWTTLVSVPMPHGLGGFGWMLARTWSLALPVRNRVLAAIRCPVLILWAEGDRYFPHAHARRALRHIPVASKRLLPEAGHAPFLEQPGLFAAEVAEFLDRS